MEHTLKEINHMMKSCKCGNKHYDILIEEIRIAGNILDQVVSFIEMKGFNKIVMLVDDHTFNAAGITLENVLKERNVPYVISLLKPDENGDVLADEISIVQVFVDTPTDIEAVVAVGAGTIHDIARFVSYKMKIPFISVPTAPSVDGFNSMGAPVIIKGYKKTLQLHSPIAVFADLDILMQAPKELRAAGFGDMIGKYTSLMDWHFSHRMGEEPFCPAAANITQQALEKCVLHIDNIANGNEEGVRVLMEALIESGLAMTLFGYSHPASGGEHHVSHYWEMNSLQSGSKQKLHGAKVGVASILILNRYRNELKDLMNLSMQQSSRDQLNKSFIHNIVHYHKALEELINKLPHPDELKELLQKVGAPVLPTDLELDDELVEKSLLEAHNIRDRYTILRYLNENSKLPRQ